MKLSWKKQSQQKKIFKSSRLQNKLVCTLSVIGKKVIIAIVSSSCKTTKLSPVLQMSSSRGFNNSNRTTRLTIHTYIPRYIRQKSHLEVQLEQPGEGNSRQDADAWSEGEHEPDHDPGKVDGAHGVQHDEHALVVDVLDHVPKGEVRVMSNSLPYYVLSMQVLP